MLPLALLLYVLLCLFLHPYLGYILDSDGVAYLAIAKRVANAQYLQSINGLWSPLNSWLLVPFIEKGMDAWTIAKILNFVFGGIVIVLVHLLFIRFKIKKIAHAFLLMALSVVMVHNVYLQTFGDVLQLIFALLYLLILWSENFYSSYWKATLCGLIMGIAFYAKAYSLAFFLFHFAATLYWFYSKKKVTLKNTVIMYCLGIFTALLLILPWTYALHKKYGVWSLTGFAGKLNMSWYINSGKTFKSDIKLLIPPSYNDSPSFWEDPYPSQENLSSPFSSGKHFIKWITRVIHTKLTAIECYNEISFLALSILLISLYYFFFRKKEVDEVEDNIQIQLLIFTILILPLGYLMMHIETRYIWLNIFLLMIAGAVLLERVKKFIHPYLYLISIFILAFSFIIFPVLNIENLKNKNKELFEYAAILEKNNIKGSFTSNAIDAGRMWVVAYLSQNQFYTIERTDYTEQELIDEMKRYHVTYYLFQSENNKPSIQLDEQFFHLLFKTNGFDLYELRP